METNVEGWIVAERALHLDSAPPRRQLADRPRSHVDGRENKLDRMYDVIVIGLGGMGAAALSALARRGHRALGLEQFAIGHDRGSSHGHTRVIRTAYYEHPAYVPLCRQAFTAWRDLECRIGRKLLVDCPCLSIGRPDGELVSGVERAARDHRLDIERLPPENLRK